MPGHLADYVEQVPVNNVLMVVLLHYRPENKLPFEKVRYRFPQLAFHSHVPLQ